MLSIQVGHPRNTPIFCFPGAGATVASFCALAESLGAHVPVRGLQPRGLDTDEDPFADISTASELYAEAIREMTGIGPYHLLGHSFGGWVALATAQILIDSGAQVAELVLLDSDAPPAANARSQRLPRVAALMKLVRLFELRTEKPFGIKGDALAMLSEEEQLQLLLSHLVQARVLPARSGLAVLRRLALVFETNVNTAFLPSKPYLGRIHLMVAEQRTEGLSVENHAESWRPHAPNACWTQCPGNHVTMLMPPHVQVLAKKLQPVLAAPA